MPNETPLSDLFSGLKMLADGAQQVAVGRAIRQASDDVNEVRLQEQDDTSKLQNLRNIAGNLTMNLAAIGAPDETIKSVAEGITGPKPPLVQTPEQGFIIGNDVERARSKQLIDQDYAFKMAALGEKNKGKDTDKLQSNIERGQKLLIQSQAKSYEGLKSAQLLESLALNRQPVTDNALANLTSRSTGDVGNITEQERDQLRGSQAFAAKLRRKLQKGWDGTLDEPDRQQLLQYAQILQKGNRASITNRGKLIATQIARNHGADVNDVMSKILPDEVAVQAPSTDTGLSTAPASLGTPGSLKSLLVPR